MTDAEPPLSRSSALASLVPAPLLAVIGAVLVLVLVEPDERFGALCLSLAGCALAAFLVQLAVRRREGFVARVTLGIVSAVIVTAVASILAAFTL